MKKKLFGNGLILTGVATIAASIGYLIGQREQDVDVCEDDIQINEEVELESELENEIETEEIEENQIEENYENE